MYRTLPTTLSLELRMQSYDNFLNPPNFRRSFFWEPHPCVWHLLYIGVPRSHLRGHLLYIVSVRTWGLNKETDKQLSSRQNLLTTQGSPDTSEDPFFWVASAKVIQLPETTKLSTNFFRRMSDRPLGKNKPHLEIGGVRAIREVGVIGADRSARTSSGTSSTSDPSQQLTAKSHQLISQGWCIIYNELIDLFTPRLSLMCSPWQSDYNASALAGEIWR